MIESKKSFIDQFTFSIMSNSFGQTLQIDSRIEIDSQLGDAKSFILRIFSVLTRKCVQRTVHNCA